MKFTHGKPAVGKLYSSIEVMVVFANNKAAIYILSAAWMMEPTVIQQQIYSLNPIMTSFALYYKDYENYFFK